MDALEALRLTHSQWSSRYLDQIEPEDYPGLLDSMEAAIAAWEKERAERAGDAEGFAQKVDELAALRAEALKIAEEMDEEMCTCGNPSGRAEVTGLCSDCGGYYAPRLNTVAERLRKACE